MPIFFLFVWVCTIGQGAPLLHGVRVVELATVIAAPSATRMMVDLGAEVVKIEEPKVCC